MFFSIVQWIAPTIYIPTTSFQLMALRNIMVEEGLLSTGASDTMKHPIQFNLKK